jgi:hypothetical protein
MQLGPSLLGEEMRKPQHHAETEILSDHEIVGSPLDERIHLADLARQVLLVAQAIGHIAVKGIERAEPISGIRPAQILQITPRPGTTNGSWICRASVTPCSR